MDDKALYAGHLHPIFLSIYIEMEVRSLKMNMTPAHLKTWKQGMIFCYVFGLVHRKEAAEQGNES